MWALLPLKCFDKAKQRLAGVLTAQQRRGLFVAMVRDVLDVLASHPDIESILIVSDDEAAVILAQEYGAKLMREPATGPAGLNNSVQAGISALHQRGVCEAMVIHGDLPLITAEEITRLVRMHRSGELPAVNAGMGQAAQASLTLAPDIHHAGTNCLVCDPASGMTFHYGVNSFAAHVREAKQRGFLLQVAIAPGLSRDIDCPPDLLALIDCDTDAVAPQSRHYLQSSGLLPRLAGLAQENNQQSGNPYGMPLNRVG